MNISSIFPKNFDISTHPSALVDATTGDAPVAAEAPAVSTPSVATAPSSAQFIFEAPDSPDTASHFEGSGCLEDSAHSEDIETAIEAYEPFNGHSQLAPSHITAHFSSQSHRYLSLNTGSSVLNLLMNRVAIRQGSSIQLSGGHVTAQIAISLGMCLAACESGKKSVYLDFDWTLTMAMIEAAGLLPYFDPDDSGSLFVVLRPRTLTSTETVLNWFVADPYRARQTKVVVVHAIYDVLMRAATQRPELQSKANSLLPWLNRVTTLANIVRHKESPTVVWTHRRIPTTAQTVAQQTVAPQAISQAASPSDFPSNHPSDFPSNSPSNDAEGGHSGVNMGVVANGSGSGDYPRVLSILISKTLNRNAAYTVRIGALQRVEDAGCEALPLRYRLPLEGFFGNSGGISDHLDLILQANGQFDNE